jgi:hypothetical protein
LRAHLLATGERNSNQYRRVALDGGDVLKGSTGGHRDLTLLAVAAQFGAARCTQFLLTSGAKAGASEVGAAFRGESVEVMRLLWDAFPTADALEMSLEAVKSWNSEGLRWLLDHKMGSLSPRSLVRLFEGACSSGSYLCASAVMGFSASADSHLRLRRPVGVVGRVLSGGLLSRKAKRDVLFIPEDSVAAAYAEELSEWLPEATEVSLIARHEGRDLVSVYAFIDAATGRARTLTFVETENGGSICGGYLDVAWVDCNYAKDPGRRSFIFTLKNHPGGAPTKFALIRDECAACMTRNYSFYFGQAEGLMVWHSDRSLTTGQMYEAPEQGAGLFDGDDGAKFHAARWELWQAC